VRMLRGMFAFALWDCRTRNLAMGRDALGIKPLYLARNRDPAGDWSIVFASEVRAILASELLGRAKLNPQAITTLAWNGFVVCPATALAGIESVWPGQVRVFDVSGKEESSEFFWSAAPHQYAPPTDEEELEHALEESVRLHLLSDVPVGVFLSAGV